MLTQGNLRQNIFLFILIITGTVFVGVSGYMTIEGWNFTDSLFMTTITISTVGYSEVNGLSLEGKIFTIFLIIISFGNFAFAITSLTRYVVEGEYKKDLRELRVKRNLSKMENHIIVAGYGRVGKQVVKDLLEIGKKVVVIEEEISIIEDLEDKIKFQFVGGNATKDEVLIRSGIEKASAIVTCLPNDSENLYVVLAAREFNKELTIISRASKSEAVAKLKIAGATNVVMPDSIGGSHMATLLASPLVADFLDLISVTGESEVNIECILFDHLPEAFQNHRIGTMDAKNQTGVNIVGLKLPNGEYIINPPDEIELIEGSRLFVLGTTEQISYLHRYLGHVAE
jgi:voltage-gated potassium channel